MLVENKTRTAGKNMLSTEDLIVPEEGSLKLADGLAESRDSGLDTSGSLNGCSCTKDTKYDKLKEELAFKDVMISTLQESNQSLRLRVAAAENKAAELRLICERHCSCCAQTHWPSEDSKEKDMKWMEDASSSDFFGRFNNNKTTESHTSITKHKSDAKNIVNEENPSEKEEQIQRKGGGEAWGLGKGRGMKKKEEEDFRRTAGGDSSSQEDVKSKREDVEKEKRQLRRDGWRVKTEFWVGRGKENGEWEELPKENEEVWKKYEDSSRAQVSVRGWKPEEGSRRRMDMSKSTKKESNESSPSMIACENNDMDAEDLTRVTHFSMYGDQGISITLSHRIPKPLPSIKRKQSTGVVTLTESQISLLKGRSRLSRMLRPVDSTSSTCSSVGSTSPTNNLDTEERPYRRMMMNSSRMGGGAKGSRMMNSTVNVSDAPKSPQPSMSTGFRTWVNPGRSSLLSCADPETSWPVIDEHPHTKLMGTPQMVTSTPKSTHLRSWDRLYECLSEADAYAETLAKGLSKISNTSKP